MQQNDINDREYFQKCFLESILAKVLRGYNLIRRCKTKQKGQNMKLNITVKFLLRNRCYIKGEKRTPIGIQIHTIGTAQGTAQSVADYWNQAAVPACVTYCVDADVSGKVMQFLPEWMRSWADAGWGNNNLITIEICESDHMKYIPGTANYKVIDERKVKADIMRGYKTAVELCADICKRYGWKPKEKLENGMYRISSHKEGNLAGLSSNHGDPDHIWGRYGLTMDKFRDDVETAMKKELTQGMKVKLVQDIAIRTGVSTKEKQAGYVRYRNLPVKAKRKCKRLAGGKARLKAGNIVEIRELCKSYDGNTWARIKNGWLPVIVNGVWRVN